MLLKFFVGQTLFWLILGKTMRIGSMLEFVRLVKEVPRSKRKVETRTTYCTFIMGVMADKDYGEMIRELLPLALDFKTVTVESERALQGEALADCIRAKGIPAEAYRNLEDVLPDFSKSSAEKTVAFGSLYFIGEIEAFLRGKQ